MHQLASFGTLLCVVLASGALAYLLWAFQIDKYEDAHLLHGPHDGCAECEDK